MSDTESAAGFPTKESLRRMADGCPPADMETAKAAIKATATLCLRLLDEVESADRVTITAIEERAGLARLLTAERAAHDLTAEALGAFFDDPHDLLRTCMDMRGRPRKGGRPCATCDTARTALAAWKESRA